jgi:radical SAM protein with 4Fe4S-binding SPASM domain
MTRPTGLARVLTAADRSHVPIEVALELTHRCDLACHHCFLAGGSPREPLPTERWTALLDELADAGTLFLCLTGGDPLLHPGWVAIVEHARQRRFAVRLFTNATRVDSAVARRLAALDVRVEVSLLSLKPDVHDRLSGAAGQLHRVTTGLEELARHGVRLRVKMPVLRDNLPELASIAELAAGLGAQLSADARVIPARSGDLAPLQQRLSDDELAMLLRTPWGAPSSPTGPPPQHLAEPCGAGRRFCTIAPDGDVLACMALPEVAGSIRTTPFGEVWSGSPWLQRLRNVQIGDLAPCASCPDYSQCARCPGQALIEDGDLLGPSTWSCRRAALLRAQQSRSA